MLSMVACNKSDQIIVDVSQEGAEVPSSLYGVFFRRNYTFRDGGLYAEMVLNRGFEDGNLSSGTVYEDGYAVSKDLPLLFQRLDQSFQGEMAGWKR